MNKVMSFLVVLGFSWSAQAATVFEPYLGYDTGSADYQFHSSNSNTSTYLNIGDTGTFSGVTLGARLTYKFWWLWAGLDASLGLAGRMNWEDEDGGDVKKENLSFVVGIDLPIPVRFWAGLGMYDKLKVSGGNDLDGVSSLKLGVGFTGLPYVSVNLEFLTNHYEYSKSQNGIHVKQDVDLRNTMMLSVSLPLSY